MRLSPKVGIGASPPNDWLGKVVQSITRILESHAQQINGISEGQAFAFHTAQTAAPTGGTYAKGDFIPNSNITELGSPGSKYIVEGWRCLDAGAPGTWVDQRALTGN